MANNPFLKIKGYFKNVLFKNSHGSSTMEYVIVIAGVALLGTVLYSTMNDEGGSWVKTTVPKIFNGEELSVDSSDVMNPNQSDEDDSSSAQEKPNADPEKAGGDEDECAGVYGFVACNVAGYTGNIYDGIKGLPSMLSAANGYQLKPTNLPPWMGHYQRQAYEVARKNWLKLGNVGEGVPRYSQYITRSHSQFKGIYHGVGQAAKGNAVIGGLLNMTQTSMKAYGEYKRTGTIADKTQLTADLIVDFGIGATAGVASTAAGAVAAGATGASLGSVVPGVGTAVGFAVGFGITWALNTERGQAFTNSLKSGTKKALEWGREKGKEMVDTVKKGAKKAWDTVTGLFN